jgi:hypothetical protein
MKKFAVFTVGFFLDSVQNLMHLTIISYVHVRLVSRGSLIFFNFHFLQELLHLSQELSRLKQEHSHGIEKDVNDAKVVKVLVKIEK